eukprot:TRINITY_DN105705_c0_g1_i1.p1 TRINITY_DN105705_c0_g1~~TRINITY_DN105705_c0_g1_i1.p1  ORF type:complete len:319 (+),score=43.41 TRINITY_DN105705_c0_g1_i1:23-958(+)
MEELGSKLDTLIELFKQTQARKERSQLSWVRAAAGRKGGVASGLKRKAKVEKSTVVVEPKPVKTSEPKRVKKSAPEVIELSSDDDDVQIIETKVKVKTEIKTEAELKVSKPNPRNRLYQVPGCLHCRGKKGVNCLQKVDGAPCLQCVLDHLACPLAEDGWYEAHPLLKPDVEEAEATAPQPVSIIGATTKKGFTYVTLYDEETKLEWDQTPAKLKVGQVGLALLWAQANSDKDPSTWTKVTCDSLPDVPKGSPETLRAQVKSLLDKMFSPTPPQKKAKLNVQPRRDTRSPLDIYWDNVLAHDPLDEVISED